MTKNMITLNHLNLHVDQLMIKKIIELNNLLSVIDWTTLHQSNVNLAFTQLQTKIEECMDKNITS